MLMVRVERTLFQPKNSKKMLSRLAQKTFHLHNAHFNFKIICGMNRGESISMMTELKCSSLSRVVSGVCDESPFTLTCCIMCFCYPFYVNGRNLNRSQLADGGPPWLCGRSFSHSWFCATFSKYFLMTCNYAPLVLSPPSSVASLFCDVNNSVEILIPTNTADILMNPRHHDKLIIVFLFLVSQTQILWKLIWAYVRCIMLCRRDNVAEMRYGDRLAGETADERGSTDITL